MNIIKGAVILIVSAIVWSNTVCENYNKDRIKRKDGDKNNSDKYEITSRENCLCKLPSKCIQLYTNYDKYIKDTCIVSTGGDGICCPYERNYDEESSTEEFPNLDLNAFERKISYRVPNLKPAEISPSVKKGQESQNEDEQISDELLKRDIIKKPGSPASDTLESLKVSDKPLKESKLAGLASSAAADLISSLSLTLTQILGLPHLIFDNKEEKFACPKSPLCKDKKYRTFDGSCNNLKHGNWGKSSTAFTRILPAAYADDIKKPRVAANGNELPSARVISTTVIQDLKKPDPKLTSAFSQFGQFLSHEISFSAIRTGQNNVAIKCCDPEIIANPYLRHPECFEIKIPSNDPFYSRFNQTCMEFVRTLEVSMPFCDFGAREQMNQQTSFIDGSIIYGATSKEAKALRTFHNGKLRAEYCNGEQFLPFKKKDQSCSSLNFTAGDERVNELRILLVYHILFFRFHNNVADQLRILNRHWNDERIYQEARKFFVATLQHIAYAEFLPTLIGMKLMRKLNLLPKEKGYSNSYNPSVNPSILNDLATAGLRLHTLVSANEEYADHNRKSIEQVPLRYSFFTPSKIAKGNNFDNMLRGLTVQPIQKFDNYFTKELTNHVLQENQPFGLDLAALDIQRGRDHGLRPYKDYRKICRLRALKSFKDMEKVMTQDAPPRFKRVYKSIDDIDFWVGGTSEQPMRGAVVGPTFACIIGEQFRRLKFGDRYWYENGNQKSSFSEDQLKAIRDMSFARLICDNGGNIKQIQPLPFYQPTKYNKITSCRSPSIPIMNLSSWKD